MNRDPAHPAALGQSDFKSSQSHRARQAKSAIIAERGKTVEEGTLDHWSTAVRKKVT